ncbi:MULTISPECIES: hypothetical protein [unclassified Breznakia]|uniref:hypothetical protein n=1 Tax=unclassified Breznakia TaxID=2623764 RepID=UPI002474B852|nr:MULTISPECIES: hypothetical protein [unclassified Breznakia]MDH6368032.1 hypothetical protein [Breznakia sp. PH1-1]MDH6405120.1 hypothetical protein [Breznakia sp. PF1-11]MDH6412835.1 hypothetical protein [Breznakia sp. PFB1-11]MDH6415195.1 hypothetical protein [Breznakia sp. PFB1-14]MDH6417506.1 hypothetical protein [Breznakia sp. PFB1-4]
MNEKTGVNQNKIIEDAIRMYDAGLVVLQEKEEDTYKFIVDGQNVVVNSFTEEILHCDCGACTPYADCVHAIAALLWIGDQENDELDNLEVDYDIIELVESTDYEFVKQFACAVLHDNPSLVEMFKAIRDERDELLDEIENTSFMNTLDLLFKRYRNSDDTYYNVDGLLDDLDAIVDEEAKSLIEDEQMSSVLDMARIVHMFLVSIDEAYMERVGMSYDHLLGYVGKFSRKLPAREKDDVFTALKEIVVEYGFGTYTYVAEDVFIEEFSDVKYLKEKIDVCFEKIHESAMLDDKDMNDMLYSRWMSNIVGLYLQAGYGLEDIQEKVKDEYNNTMTRAILIEAGKKTKAYPFVKQVLMDSITLDQQHSYLVKKYEKELERINKLNGTQLN